MIQYSCHKYPITTKNTQLLPKITQILAKSTQFFIKKQSHYWQKCPIITIKASSWQKNTQFLTQNIQLLPKIPLSSPKYPLSPQSSYILSKNNQILPNFWYCQKNTQIESKNKILSNIYLKCIKKLDNLAIICIYLNSSWQFNYLVTLQTSTFDIIFWDESSQVIDIGSMSTNSSRIIYYCPKLVLNESG